MLLPERDPAGLAYLESLQKENGFAFSVDLSPKGEDAYRELASGLMALGASPPDMDLERFARALQQSHEVPDPARWSAQERPDYRLRLWRAERAVVRGMEALGKALPSPLPALGTLSTWQLNAKAFPVPSTNGYIIAFDSGLFSFTAGWAGVLAGCLSPVEDGGLLDRFVDLCFCQVLLGTAAFLDQRPVMNPALTALGERFAPVFEAFLLGHEYAHVVLGHQPVDLNLPEGSHAEQGFNPTEELDADALGFKVVLHAFPDPVLVYSSVAGFFCALHLMERGYELRGMPADDSHPQARERRAALLKLASELLSREALAQALPIVDRIEECTLRMWLPLERGFRQGPPAGWAPRTPGEKSAALFAFKLYCLGPPASLR